MQREICGAIVCSENNGKQMACLISWHCFAFGVLSGMQIFFRSKRCSYCSFVFLLLFGCGILLTFGVVNIVSPVFVSVFHQRNKSRPTKLADDMYLVALLSHVHWYHVLQSSLVIKHQSLRKCRISWSSRFRSTPATMFPYIVSLRSPSMGGLLQ